MIERLEQLEDLFAKFRITGGSGVTVEGGLDTGYAVNLRNRLLGGEGVEDGGGEVPITGACCLDGGCSVRTVTSCSSIGGDYQGDDTTCEPNPCAVGACCVEGDCSITTAEDCTGIYMGDGTTCVPNPCSLECCGVNSPYEGGYIFIDPGTSLCYSTRNRPCGGGQTFFGLVDCSALFLHYIGTCTECSGSITATVEITLDPDTCELIQTCVGSGCDDAHNVNHDFWFTGGNHKEESFSGQCTETAPGLEDVEISDLRFDQFWV